MNKFFILFLIIFSGNQIFSQVNFDYNYIEKKTYDYYLTKQWDSLIYIGNIALQNNIDYFYLRSRIGAAYFEKKNYLKASKQFEKAMIFNGSDNFVLESLYYCYTYLDRENDANFLLKKHSQIFSDKIKPTFFREIYFESGSSFIKDSENNKLLQMKENVDWTESNLTNNILYNSLGIKYNINKYIIVTTSYSNLKIYNTKQILIGNEILKDNYNLYQNQIYTNLKYRLSNGTIIIPAIHYILVDYKTLFSKFDTTKNKVIQERKGITLNDFAFSLAFDKKYNNFGINLFGTYSHLNNNTQNQIGLSISSAPLGNLNFYTITTLVVQHTKNKLNFIGEQNLGFKTSKHLWFEGFVTFGELENYIEKNAMVVYNINEVINFRTGLSIIIPYNKFQLSFRYNYIKKSVPFDFYKNSLKTTSFNQHQHLILGILSYKF
ncbi:MAG: hypothetical protein HY951_03640 [Bacteroidia bacterium]|nr:hypothetical protein [Bacteroidia bacterium]